MAGDIETDRFLFIRQQDILRPLFHIRQLPVGMAVLGDDLLGTKERLLTGLLFPLDLLTIFHGFFQRSHKLRPFVAQRVKGSTLDKGLNHTLINPPQINTFTKIMQGLKLATSFTRLDNRFDGTTTDSLDGTEAKANVILMNSEVTT